VIRRVFGSVAGVEGTGIPSLEECLLSMPAFEEYPTGMHIPGAGPEIASETLMVMLPLWAKCLSEDDEVVSGEGEGRALIFRSAFKTLSDTWTKKTGRKYYVEERPKYEEILEVMKKAVEAGIQQDPTAIIEKYYAHRRLNFVKYFNEIAKESAAGETGATYKYEMSVTTTGWWDAVTAPDLDYLIS